MAAGPYTSLTNALTAAGLTAQRSRPHQMIVSTQEGPVWPDRGNSFWVSHHQGIWYLSTWAPTYYRVPANQDIVAVCLACMAVGNSAMFQVPPDIVARFGLEQIDDRQYERLFPTEGQGD